MPWEIVHPDAEQWYREAVHFNPFDVFWRAGVLVAGLGVLTLSSTALRREVPRSGLAVGVVAVSAVVGIWLYVALTSGLSVPSVDFVLSKPDWFTESEIPAFGFDVSAIAAALALISGVGTWVLHIRERRAIRRTEQRSL